MGNPGNVRRTTHKAVVDEVIDADGDWAFRATCLETGTMCDAWAFPGLLIPDEEPGDGAAIERALGYLGDWRLHGAGSPHFCNARHVLP